MDPGVSGECDPKKLRELVRYVSAQSRSEQRLNRGRLACLLYFCDFAAYRELGRPITGVSYLHGERGPYPDGLDSILEELQAAGALGELRPDRSIVSRPANADQLARAEIELADRVVQELGSLTATQLERKARKEPGYRLTKPSQVIAYATAIIAARPLTKEDIARGQELATELGLLA
jgi:hypothetical protein